LITRSLASEKMNSWPKAAIMNKDIFSGDEAFDSLYSLRARQLSAIHWTPMEIAKKAGAFLCADGGKHILDIGSGVGKFCIIAAHFNNDFVFHGIEQRKSLTDEALIAQKATNTGNVNFIQGNFNNLRMEEFDHFYFYNSFMENLDYHIPIDNLIPTSAEIYTEYLQTFQDVLEDRKPGTRLATYHADEHYIPGSYKKINHRPGNPLILWIKNS